MYSPTEEVCIFNDLRKVCKNYALAKKGLLCAAGVCEHEKTKSFTSDQLKEMPSIREALPHAEKN